MRILRLLKLVGLLIGIYVYIYSPPLRLFPFGLIKFLLIFLLFDSIFSRKLRSFFAIYHLELALLFGIFSYAVLISIARLNFSGGLLYQISGLLFEGLPLGIYIVFKAKQWGFLLKDFVSLVYMTGTIAALITLYLLLNPGAQYFVNNTLLRSSDFLSNVKFRGFGFGSSLLFSFGVAQGIFCAMSLYFLMNSKSHLAKPFHFVISVLLAVSIMVNARVGILIPMGFLLYSLFSGRVYRLFTLFLFGYCCYSLIDLSLIEELFDPAIIEFVLEFFDETKNAQDSGTTYHIIRESIVFPQSITGWLFGYGYNLFYGEYIRSDMGWLIMLHYGGLFYMLLYACFFMVVIKRLCLNRYAHWLAVIMVITIVVANSKGHFLGNNSAMRLLLLLYISFSAGSKIEVRGDF